MTGLAWPKYKKDILEKQSLLAMIHLTRNFSILSAVTIITVTTFLGYNHFRDEETVLHEQFAENSTILARSITNTIWPIYSHLIEPVKAAPQPPSRDDLDIISLHNTLKNLVTGLPILKIKIYDKNGLTVYSTQFAENEKDHNKEILTHVQKTKNVRSSISFEENFKSYNGIKKNIHFVETYVPVLNANNVLVGILELYTDITDQRLAIEQHTFQILFYLICAMFILYLALLVIVRKAEKTLKTQQQDLKAQILKQKSAELDLILAKDQAEAASKAKSTFLSSMSHELRTPLNGILGFAQMLEMNRSKNLDEREETWVKQIMQAGRHLLNLIDDVLDLSRIESGTISNHPESVDPYALYLDCKGILQNEADKRGITLTDAITSQQPVYVDRSKLKQIFLNLIGNAIKYGRENGKVIFGSENSHDDCVTLYVEDDGIGIPAKEIDQIFQPFYRSHHVINVIEGTGIGLSVVQKHLEQMNGSISVESEVGKGTRFTLTIPKQGQNVATEKPTDYVI
ncbi:MAG: HAMP domain-containing histidine kinase [Methylocystaceae bacterium]|nr:HAMP domain-containing histidine kinase [Methylocystaceae bacterium]